MRQICGAVLFTLNTARWRAVEVSGSTGEKVFDYPSLMLYKRGSDRSLDLFA